MEGNNSYHHFNTEKKKKQKINSSDTIDITETTSDNCIVNEGSHEGGENDANIDTENSDNMGVDEKLQSTGRNKPTDRRALGTIYSFQAHPELISVVPAVTDGEEASSPLCKRMFVKLTISGKFFLYKQIRIMIGAALGIYHGLLPENTVQIAFNSFEDRFVFPVAPAEGLLCVDTGFDRNKGGSIYVTNFNDYKRELDSYSSTASSSSSSSSAAAIGEIYFPLLDQDAFLLSNTFKSTSIYPEIAALYSSERCERWLEVLYKYYSYDSVLAPEGFSIADVEKRKEQSQQREWAKVMLAIQALRQRLTQMETGSDITPVDDRILWSIPLNRKIHSLSLGQHKQKVPSSNKSQINSASKTLKPYRTVLDRNEENNYYPYRLFLPRGLFTTMVSFMYFPTFCPSLCFILCWGCVSVCYCSLMLLVYTVRRLYCSIFIFKLFIYLSP